MLARLFSYYSIASLLGLFLPTKEDAAKLRHFCREIDDRKVVDKVHKNYELVLENLRKKYKKEKIKVVFLNDTVAKWQYQSLYEELSNDPDFEVQILVTVENYHISKKMAGLVDYVEKAQKVYRFFSENNMKVDYAFDFDKNKPIDLKEFSPDIIFYQQAWGVFPQHGIEETSAFSLGCYSSYGSAITNGRNEHGSTFFRLLYRNFIDNEFAKWNLINHSVKPEAVVVSGQPKWDAYRKPLDEKTSPWKTQGKKRIIYAPHFSFYPETVLRLGTFNLNGKFMLEYAKSHPEYEFMFKPHPRLSEDIVRRNLMTAEERDEYYNTWAQLPNTQFYDGANYIDIFKSSDLLITDCNSFLFEYLPTNNPVVRLINKNFVGFNMFGEKLVSGYYNANNTQEIETLVEELLEKKNDYKKEIRTRLLSTDLQHPEGYAKFVVEHLKNEIEVDNCCAFC